MFRKVAKDESKSVERVRYEEKSNQGREGGMMRGGAGRRMQGRKTKS